MEQQQSEKKSLQKEDSLDINYVLQMLEGRPAEASVPTATAAPVASATTTAGTAASHPQQQQQPPPPYPYTQRQQLHEEEGGPLALEDSEGKKRITIRHLVRSLAVAENNGAFVNAKGKEPSSSDETARGASHS